MKFKRVLLSLVSTMAISSAAGAVVLTSQKGLKEAADALVGIEGVEDYGAFIDSWSKPGHIYFHYNRGADATSTNYNGYALWLWQHKPQDIDGSLWAYGGKTDISDTLTLQPMSTGFMTGADVKKSGGDMWIDQYGAIIDVDTNLDILPGKAGPGNASLAGATELGFLMVAEYSMGGNTHWTSDGGKNTYLENINQHWRDDGSLHVYINTGTFDEYVFNYEEAPAVKINPVTKDESGEYRSQTEEILDKFGVSSTSDAFKNMGVGYQVFVASFRDSNGDGLGDIRGIINSLDYLKELGVDVLWLTPIQQSDSYHAYDISDYYAIDSKFGTVADYRELIYKAHKSGIKVLMDLVLNHTSKSNIWFKKSQWADEGVDENGNKIEWRNVYHWKFETDKIKKLIDGQYKEITVKEDAESENPSWYKDGESRYYYYGKFGSGMPEINYEYQPTRDLVKNMAKYWLSFGLDGFRLDAVKHIYMRDEIDNPGSDIIISDTGSKTSYDNEKGKYVTLNFDYSSDMTKNIAWWKEFANFLKQTYPSCFLVGENYDGYGNRTAAYYQALDSQFGFNHYFHITEMLRYYGPGSYANKYDSEGPQAFRGDTAEYWEGGAKQPDLPGGKRPDFIDGSFTSNHDLMRMMNHVNYSSAGKEGTSVVTVDNDSITNTAEQIAYGKVAAATTMLNPGVSWIYYGDELGMSSNTNKHVEKYGNENCKDIWYRQPFLWENTSDRPNYSAGGYKIELDDNNKTNVKTMEQQAADSNSMLAYFKALGKVKGLYPKDARVSLENGSVYLIMTITGQGGHGLKIILKSGQATANPVSDDGYGVDSTGYTVLTSSVDPIYKALGADEYTHFIAPSAPVGTCVVMYK